MSPMTHIVALAELQEAKCHANNVQTDVFYEAIHTNLIKQDANNFTCSILDMNP